MPMFIPSNHAPVAPEPPALIRQLTRADVTWDRPVFKAPPLEVQPPLAEIATHTANLRRDFSLV